MKLDHINIVTPDLEAATAFLCDVIGLHVGPRPNFPFNGAWLYGEVNGPAIVHLVEGDLGSGPTGAIDHIALSGDDKDGLIQRLEAAGISYDMRVVPGRNIDQVFFMSPFGLKIEIDIHSATE